jgi:TRAP-type C4-dicarboxylate transport system substrate-binding protein
MNATRKLAGGAMTAILLIAGCSSAAPARSGAPSPSDAAAPSEAPAPSEITAKGGGGVPRPLAATLITGEGTPIDEQAFADTVLKDSGGSITITVSPSWRSGDPINDVVTGKAQMGVTATRAFGVVGVTAFEGLSAPLLIDSYGLEARVLGADVVMKQLDATRPMGVTSLDYLGGPLRQPLGLTRDLVSAGDYAGAKIGIRPSRVSEMAIRALGGTPVVYVPKHVGGLDGLEVHTDLIEGAQYDAGAKSLTGNVVLWARPSVIFVNGAWFDKLPADQQALLRRAAGEAKAASLARWSTDSQTAVEKLCRRSLIVKEASGAALAGLRSKLAPVTEALTTDAANKAVINGIRALSGSDATDFVAPCGDVAASAEPSGTATALDGTWVTSFTKADLQ